MNLVETREFGDLDVDDERLGDMRCAMLLGN